MRILWILLMMAGAALAQNSDLGLLLGGSIRVESSVRGEVNGRVSGSGQINYAVQLHETRAGLLYLELPLMITGESGGRVAPGLVTGRVGGALYLTPGLRWRFSPAHRVSFYAAGGAGVGIYWLHSEIVARTQISDTSGNTATPALGFGGGLDFRLTRLVSLRAEVRDDVTRGNIDGAVHHTLIMIGAGLHF